MAIFELGAGCVTADATGAFDEQVSSSSGAQSAGQPAIGAAVTAVLQSSAGCAPAEAGNTAIAAMQSPPRMRGGRDCTS